MAELKKTIPPNQSVLVRWKLPDKDELKINVDASWFPGEFLCSIVGIVSDPSGKVVEGFAYEVRASSSLQAEALSLLHGLSYLRELDTQHVGREKSQRVSWVCESDCSTLVDIVMGRADSPWDLEEIMERCKAELALCKSARVVFCPHKANRAADWLARTHRAKKLPSNWVSYPPLSLSEILCSDLFISMNECNIYF